MNLNQVTLPVTDMEAACDFYRLLGCLQIVDTPHYARFESPEGDATFSLHLADSVPPDGAVIYFEDYDLDALCKHLVERGIAFDQMPQDQPWLWREACLRDPAGNRIKLYCAGANRKNPPWRVEISG